MKFDAQLLYDLLPAIYRIRDAERGEPLRQLLNVIAEQVGVVQDDIEQLYADQFIETCAPWAIPYLGDLIGWNRLNNVNPKTGNIRAEVANTVAYRQRKGTAIMLEQMARDVTGWHAHVVEFFQRLAATQYMNHIRPENIVFPDMRNGAQLERLSTPFDTLARTADVRHIANRRGKYNIPNIGIFLWRLNSYPLTDVMPSKVDDYRYRFNPLGFDTPLFTKPEVMEEFSGLAGRMNVPQPITRRLLYEYLDDYYGTGKSMNLKRNDADIPWKVKIHPDDEEYVQKIVAGNLSDIDEGKWAHEPNDVIVIDPELGRIAFPKNEDPPDNAQVAFHYGYSADMGGGEYNRLTSVSSDFQQENVRVIENGITFADAIQEWYVSGNSLGVIVFPGSTTYDIGTGAEPIKIQPGRRLLIVGEGTNDSRKIFSPAGCRPFVQGDIFIQGDPSSASTTIGQIILNGIVLQGKVKASGNVPVDVMLVHCTIVPDEEVITIESPDSSITIDHSITGGVRVGGTVGVEIKDSIIDALSPAGVAVAANDGTGSCGTLRASNATIIGKIHASEMELVTNTIMLAEIVSGDEWPGVAPVLCDRVQTGCVRFSYVSPGSKTPRRYQCAPKDALAENAVWPEFSSLRYGEPGYGQLCWWCAKEIFAAADDGGSMGAFHELFEPQRIANLNIRLNEYLRFGLEAGVFFEPRRIRRIAATAMFGAQVHSPLPGALSGSGPNLS